MASPTGRMRAVRRRADIVWRRLDGGAVGLDLGTSRYFSLNGSAAELWVLLCDYREPEALVDHLVDRFGIDPARATSDVERFLSELARWDLMEERVG